MLIILFILKDTKHENQAGVWCSWTLLSHMSIGLAWHQKYHISNLSFDLWYHVCKQLTNMNRKDFTTKKENNSKNSLIVLSDDSEDTDDSIIQKRSDNAVRKQLDYTNHTNRTNSAGNTEYILKVCHWFKSVPWISFLTLYSKDSPNVVEIVQTCKFGTTRLDKQKPLRIKDTGTFVMHQHQIHLKHPYDLDADDTPGAFAKKDSVRFYEVHKDQDYL